jgi:PilZ domain
MGERRNSARHKSFLQGRIYFNNRRSAIDCLVRDVSADGAKLIFSETGSIPDIVELYIPQKDQTLRAHVQWRSDQEVGVAFKATSARNAATADLGARVDQLEVDVATLKRLIKRLKADVASTSDPEAA